MATVFSTSAVDAQVAALRQQIQATEEQLSHLREQLAHAEEAQHRAQDAGKLETDWQQEILGALSSPQYQYYQDQQPNQRFGLSNAEFKRYGRQLIMPQVGLQGQLRLKAARVLIVGAGGLGCPASAYLAGAGVGTLGLVDGDTVEESNLHRQIAHSTDRVNMFKVDSAIAYLRGLNPNVNYIPHRAHLTPSSALDIFSNYDFVLDCTDHPTSRYLISDACVLSGKPLVSASALRTEGQLTVLNNPPRAPGASDGGPCYRCVFPRPPPAESVVSCGEGGILGPVVGVMGILQALEAIKLITSPPNSPAAPPSLLLFSAYSIPQFRNVKLRSRRLDCASCSANHTVTESSLTSGSMDYVAFCGVTNPVDILPPSSRISAGDLLSTLASLSPHDDEAPIVLDVRDQTQFELCSLPNSINLPYQGIQTRLRQDTQILEDLKGRDVLVVCKLGNDSQLAVQMLETMSSGGMKSIKDVQGGFRAWRNEVDPEWPDY
ncbi:Molybdopterin-synthase sulfurtransferase, partial [Aureobasidium melanogenum]